MRTKHKVAVVGVDMGVTGDDAIIAGLRMLASGATEKLHLVHIVDPERLIDSPEQRAMYAEELTLRDGPAMLEARAKVVAERHELPHPSSAVVNHVRVGEPAAVLRQMCVDYEADLLIVGTHARRGFDRWLEGSVAEQVILSAHCPVLVARPKDYEGATKTQLPDAPYAPGEAPVGHAAHESPAHVSTTLDSWSPSDNGPTGFRIV